MPVRKRKPVEANDGSYAGMVLGAFDEMNNNVCQFCGQASTLFCDGRIRTLPNGKRFRVPRGFRNGSTTTCDAPICRSCAKKVARVHLKLATGCWWDTIDLCPDCQQVKDKPMEVYE